MDPGALGRQDLIAAITPHVNSAIKTSPCTCAYLRPERVLELAIKYGLDPNRISNFRALSDTTRSNFALEASRQMRDPKKMSLIDKTYHTAVPAADVPSRNKLINLMFQECGLVDVVLDCEEIAVSYTAVLRYMWTQSRTLTRHTSGEREPESLLKTMRFRSINHPFMSASITSSPWFTGYPISYTIRVTDEYRKHAFPLTYTSVFAVDRPESTHGLKEYQYLEDEVRIENDTPIEPGTVDITFHHGASLPASRIAGLASKYAPLGSVRVLP